MNIDYVIVSTDNNPLYDGYWEIVKKTWNKVVGVTPLLIVVGDSDFHEKYENCEIIGYKKVCDMPTSFQSQVSRMYGTKTYPNKTFLISDLDMIPLSKSYFIDNAKNINDESLLIYTSDAYGYNNQIRYPMCYNLTKGSVYDEILDLNCSFQDFVTRIYNLKFNPLWDSDELYFGKSVNYFEKKYPNRITKLERGFAEGFATKRIDRNYWELYDLSKISENYYIDSHLLRPYKKYSNEINKILNFLIK